MFDDRDQQQANTALAVISHTCQNCNQQDVKGRAISTSNLLRPIFLCRKCLGRWSDKHQRHIKRYYQQKLRKGFAG